MVFGMEINEVVLFIETEEYVNTLIAKSLLQYTIEEDKETKVRRLYDGGINIFRLLEGGLNILKRPTTRGVSLKKSVLQSR